MKRRRTTAQQVRLVADLLDRKGNTDGEIRVIGTRRHLMRDFKPAQRGGVPMCNSHPLCIVSRRGDA